MVARDSEDESVTDTGFGKQVPGLGGVDFQFVTQPAHIDPQVMTVGAMTRSPYLLQDLTLGEHPVGTGEQQGQETVFDGGQMHGFAGAADLAPRQIDDHLSKTNLGIGEFPPGPVAKLGTNSGQQFG